MKSSNESNESSDIDYNQIFKNLKNNAKPIMTNPEIISLLNLQLGDEKLITMDYPDFVYEIVNLLIVIGYEQTFNFLNKDWTEIFGDTVNQSDIRKKILFRSPLLKNTQEKFISDLQIFENVSVEAGEKCKRCGSEQTISTVKQTRSCDEAATIEITCLECRFHWRAQ